MATFIFASFQSCGESCVHVVRCKRVTPEGFPCDYSRNVPSAMCTARRSIFRSNAVYILDDPRRAQCDLTIFTGSIVVDARRFAPKLVRLMLVRPTFDLPQVRFAPYSIQFAPLFCSFAPTYQNASSPQNASRPQRYRFAPNKRVHLK